MPAVFPPQARTVADGPLTWGPERGPPGYVATVVGALATGTVVFYGALTWGGPAVDEVLFVTLAVTGCITIAYEIARYWQ